MKKIVHLKVQVVVDEEDNAYWVAEQVTKALEKSRVFHDAEAEEYGLEEEFDETQ